MLQAAAPESVEEQRLFDIVLLQECTGYYGALGQKCCPGLD